MIPIKPVIMLLALTYSGFLFGQSSQISEFDSLLDEITLREAQLKTIETPAEKVRLQTEIVELYAKALHISPQPVSFVMRYYLLTEYGRLAWFLLLDNQPQKSAEISKELLPRNSCDFDLDWVTVNLALALLNQGALENAHAIIKTRKDTILHDGRAWRTVFFNDVDLLTKAGVWYHEPDKINALFEDEGK